MTTTQPVPDQTVPAHVGEEISRVVRRRSLRRGEAAGHDLLVLRDAAAGSASDDFRLDVVMAWGDRVLPDAPIFDVHRQSPEAAAGQFGHGCSHVGLVPVSRRQAAMVVSHQVADPGSLFPEGAYDDRTRRRIEMANHGLSVVMVKRGKKPGSWLPVKPAKAPLNRRVHTGTMCKVTGPAAGHALLRTTADPTGTRVRGTLGNRAGGTTPWATVLSGEGGLGRYFDASGETDPAHAEAWQRYGIGTGGRGWHTVDPRFDLVHEPHEPNRFGWIVEVDPRKPLKKPRKLTMLGRLQHAGAHVVIARNGRAVVHLGDDEPGGHLYKYVSRDKYVAFDSVRAQRHNRKLLERGTLYVARVTGDGPEDGTFDGTGEWIPLTSDTTSYVEGMSVAEVLVHTRLAADRVSPTRMDRPRDIEPNPVNGRVYVTCAHDGRDGSLLELVPDRDNHTARSFTWNLFLVCGDPAAPWLDGLDPAEVSAMPCPDDVAFDTEGNLWFAGDGLVRVAVAGGRWGQVQRLVTVPEGTVAHAPSVVDGTSLLVGVQHGAESAGATVERPGVWVAHRAP